jgi:hypothetical protein
MDETSHKPVMKTIKKSLFQAVTNFMLHGPAAHLAANCHACGMGTADTFSPKITNPKWKCLKMGTYSYRQRCPEKGGNAVQKWRNNTRITYTNADMVPYNKYLLFKYNCHINAEYCHSVNAIKYHLKYISKGLDSATFTVDNAKPSSDASQDKHDSNEVQDYLNNRYVSPGE